MQIDVQLKLEFLLELELWFEVHFELEPKFVAHLEFKPIANLLIVEVYKMTKPLSVYKRQVMLSCFYFIQQVHSPDWIFWKMTILLATDNVFL